MVVVVVVSFVLTIVCLFFFIVAEVESTVQFQQVPVHLNERQQAAQEQCKQILQGQTTTWNCAMNGQLADIKIMPGDMVKQKRHPTAGTLTGTSFTAHDFTGGPQSLIVVVDGGKPQTINVEANCDTLVSCAAALTVQINGAAVSVDGNNLKITSGTTGLSSTVAITATGSDDAVLALFGPDPSIVQGDIGGEPTAGTLTGTSFTAHDFTGGPQSLIVVVDGGKPQTINVEANCDTLVSCAAALTVQINGAAVSVDGNNLKITSGTTGLSSTVAITATGSDDAVLALFGPDPVIQGGDARRDWVGEFTAIKSSANPEHVMVVFTSVPGQQFIVTEHMHIGDFVKVDADDLMSLTFSTVKNTIRFVPNTTIVVEECKHIVRKISDILNNFGHIHIRVEGHVQLSKKARKDPDKVEQAYVLSTERANSIVELLVLDGIPPHLITAKGFGNDFPLPKGQDDKRVEITVVEQFDGEDAARKTPAVMPQLDTDQKSVPVLAPQLDKDQKTVPVLAPQLDKDQKKAPVLAPQLDKDQKKAPALAQIFDKDGYVVNKNGRRQKNKTGQYIRRGQVPGRGRVPPPRRHSVKAVPPAQQPQQRSAPPKPAEAAKKLKQRKRNSLRKTGPPGQGPPGQAAAHALPTSPPVVAQLPKGPPGQAPLPPPISIPTNNPVLEMFAGSPHKIVDC